LTTDFAPCTSSVCSQPRVAPGQVLVEFAPRRLGASQGHAGQGVEPVAGVFQDVVQRDLQRAHVLGTAIPNSSSRALAHDLARVVNAVDRENMLGEIDANGQNRHELPLPIHLMNKRTLIVALRCRPLQQRWRRGWEVPFIR
jgi:hypothetical protein